VRVRWLVLDDPELRAKVAELYRTAYVDYRVGVEARLRAAGQPPRSRILDSADHLAEVLDRVPIHVIPCHVDRPPADGDPFALSVFYGSIMPAVWSLMLALRGRGLGSSFTTLHLQHESAVAKLLGVPDHITQVALVPVAYYTGHTFKPVERRPAADITYWNGWKQPR